MSSLDVLLTVTAISGWLAFGAVYQHLRTVRTHGGEDLASVRRLRQANADLLTRVAVLDAELKEYRRDEL